MVEPCSCERQPGCPGRVGGEEFACLLPDTGARNVDSLLNQQILPALSQQLLSHMAAGQKPRQVTLGYHEEEGVVMAFDEGTISDE